MRKRAPKAAPVATPKTSRSDGWANCLTGLGTSRDKAQASFFFPGMRLTDQSLSGMFHYDDIAARAVEKEPREKFRCGYELKLKGEEDPTEAAELVKAANKLQLDSLMQDADIWGRLYGGSLLIVGADDGQNPALPLNEARIKSVKWLNVLDRRFVYAHSYYSDPNAPNFGKPETYQITNPMGATQPLSLVHETRVIRFGGAYTDILERRTFAGWDMSILQRPYEKMRDFAQAWQATSNLLTDASQGVFKMQGLVDQIASDSNGLQTRMQLLDMSRSVARAVMLDADTEDFARVATSFAGVPDVLDRYMMLLAASFDMPVTLLMGRSPAGMNATGDSDFQHWYNKIASGQETDTRPKLERVYRLMALAKDSPISTDDPEFEITFASLDEPSPKEAADARYIQAQTDQIYILQGVTSPEEIALSRFGKGEYSAETEIDVEARKAAQAAETSFDPHVNDPDPVVVPGAPVTGEPDSQAIPPMEDDEAK